MMPNVSKRMSPSLTDEEGESKRLCLESSLLEKAESVINCSEDCQKLPVNEDELIVVKTTNDIENISAVEEENIVDDPYTLHFQHELSAKFVAEYCKDKNMEIKEYWPVLNELVIKWPIPEENHDMHILSRKVSLSDFCLKVNLLRTCQESVLLKYPNKLSPLQFELFSIVSRYVDLQFEERTYLNGEHIRLVYCLHSLNHILKARAKIIHHNYKLSKNPEEEYRDQGFTRPRVLILVPFRESCSRIVKILISLLENCDVQNKKRFQKAYGSGKDVCHKSSKPDDFAYTFSGNVDEDFKIGLRIKNKSICLYSDFYSSDMIIASPLGLKKIVGAEGDKNRDYDFLSCIEVFIVDQADVLLMQNWMHVIDIAKHMNLQPKKTHGCDFSRVHMYALEGWAKYFRQTILLGAFENIQPKSFFYFHSFNYAGNVCVQKSVQTPAINQVIVSVPQFFRKYDAKDHFADVEERFQFFISKVLPDFKDPRMSRTLIFVPSYLDFVRLRNYFRSEELSCTMICEYSDRGKVAQGRNLFYHGHRHFMLYTGRFHFYHRYSIKGVKHIIFYQLPTYAEFYPEICHFLLHINVKEVSPSDQSVTVIVSKYDSIQLKYFVGIKNAKCMLNSRKDVFMIRS